MLSDTNLITFKAIINFVNDLNSLFGEFQHSLKLYHHLITKTTFAHDKPILKHIEAFTAYCVANHEAIMNKDKNRLNQDNIQYSERVYINIHKLFFPTTAKFKNIDAETEEAIWKHLIYLSARTNPNENALRMLKSVIESKSEGKRAESKTGGVNINIAGEGKEKEFLTNIMNKVENCIDPNATNPLQAISAVMSSGLITELVSDMGQGIENGSLNLNSLMGTVQNMVAGMNTGSGGEGGAQTNPLGGIDMTSISTMMQQMMSNGGTGGTSGGEMPDMSGLLGTLMGSMGGAGGGGGDMASLLGTLMSGMQNTQSQTPTRMKEPPRVEDDIE
jgi:hypothetical protein